jgi:hypothetical protein
LISSPVPACFRHDHRGPAGLGLDGVGDILATLDAPRQAEEVGPSQLTQALVGTQPTQPLGGATLAAGGVTPYAAGSSQAAMATPFPDQLGPRVVGHLTPGRTTGTTPGLALEMLGRRGTDTFRCSSTFTMILYKLFASTR